MYRFLLGRRRNLSFSGAGDADAVELEAAGSRGAEYIRRVLSMGDIPYRRRHYAFSWDT